MILKQPNRRETHLDLKFLDLKIMSIQPESSFASVNSKALKQNGLDEDKTFSSKCRNKFGDQSTNKYSKISNSYSKYRQQDYTNDVTINQMYGSKGNSIAGVSEREEQTQCLNQSIIKYLNVDTSQLYNQIKVQDNEKRKKKQSPIANCIDSIDRLIGKYHSQIEQIERENNLIHKEIKNIHISKLNDKNSKVKIITNMKVFQNIGQNRVVPSLDCQNNEANFDLCRYRSQNKHIVDTHRSLFPKYPILENKLYKECKERENNWQRKTKQSQKQGKSIGNDSKGLERLIKMKKKGMSQFPALIHNKYENFYEDLFKDKENCSNTKNKSDPNFSQNPSPNEVEIDRLNELKKKMLNNNFDKNFQAYLVSRKLRVPEFLKNLR